MPYEKLIRVSAVVKKDLDGIKFVPQEPYNDVIARLIRNYITRQRKRIRKKAG